MRHFLAAAAVSLGALFASTAAIAGPYPFGDEPYRLDFGPDARVESGCYKWNWQQYQWNNHCPVYIRPKAYMYPHRHLLRTRG